MALEKTNKVNKSFSAAMMLGMVFAGMHIGTHGDSSIVAHADNVQQNQNNQNNQNNQTYTVKSGDTLSQIAKDNNITVDDLKGLNSLNSDLIHPDQQLKVAKQATTYKVKSGDTLSQIAKDNNTTVDNLHKLNNIQDNNKIYVDQQLKLVDDQNQQQTQQAQPQTQSVQQAQPAQQTQTANVSQLNGTVKQKAVQLAQQYANMNIPYVWGGLTPAGFDCSGLTSYVYGQLGVNIGRNTVAQEGHVTTKAVSQAEPGDLLFWGGHGATYHVAIYIGNNQYVAAPEPGQNVQVQTINSYFMPSFAGSVNG